MDLTPREQFNCSIFHKVLDIPIDIPKATHLNVPIGTRPCDRLGFLCHPQFYPNFHNGIRLYEDAGIRDIQVESKLYSLDYYNPFDCFEMSKKPNEQNVDHRLPCLPQIWNNHSKLHKFKMPF